MVNFDVSTPIDKTADLLKGLNFLTNTDVLVGIPEEKGTRKKGEISNAQLAYIHSNGSRRKSMREEMQPMLNAGKPYSKALAMYQLEHGSPLWHSPPRPFIEPAINDIKDSIAGYLGDASKKAMNGETAKAETTLKRAGMLAMNHVRGWFTNPKNGWAANSPLTIMQKGSDRPLIDTGALRKSINYVLRKGGR